MRGVQFKFRGEHFAVSLDSMSHLHTYVTFYLENKNKILHRYVTINYFKITPAPKH